MKKFLAFLLAFILAMPMPMTSGPATHVHAAEEKATIQLGLDGLESVKRTQGPTSDTYYHIPSSYLFYGNWENEPIKWRVLDADISNMGGNEGVFLLTEYTYDNPADPERKVYYDITRNPGSYQWEGSDAQEWMTDTFLSDSNFTSIEKTGILLTNYQDPLVPNIDGAPWEKNSLIDEKAFFLSITEVANYLSNYARGTDAHLAFSHEDKTTVKAWWMRSTKSKQHSYMGNVSLGAGFNMSAVTTGVDARPAMNLDRNKILFISKAEGVKHALTGEDLQEIPKENNLKEWKATVLDSTRQFNVTQTQVNTQAGSTVTLNYTGAKTGANEYISAILSDGEEALYYTRIMQASNAGGTVNVKIPETLQDGVYQLKVFNEQQNGGSSDSDKKSDYASAFSDVSLTVGSTVTDTQPPGVTLETAKRDSHTSAAITFNSTETGRYYYAIADIGATQPTIDTSGAGISCVAGQQILTLKSLTEGEQDVYIVVKDAAGNVSDALKITLDAYVPPVPVYSIEISPSSLQFGPVAEDYNTRPAAQTVTVRNTGNQTIIIERPVSTTSYNISSSSGFHGGILLPEGTITFTVRPRSGLSVEGSPYNEVIQVTGDNGVSGTLSVSFIIGNNTGTEPHTHQYSGYKYDSENHWKECSDVNCPEEDKGKTEVAAHEYTDDKDIDCNICGYEREVVIPEPPVHEHTYGKYEKDEEGHWKECSDVNCPEEDKGKTEVEAHEYTDDKDIDCNICGYEREVVIPEPPVHEHTYGEYEEDEEGHWKKCSDTNCPEEDKGKTEVEAHEYTDENDESCNICDYIRKVLPGDTENPVNPDIPDDSDKPVIPTDKPDIMIKALNQKIQPGESLKQDVSQVEAEGLPQDVRINSITLISGFTSSEQVGYTTITVSGANLIDVSGNDVTADYDITYQPGELKVFPKDIWIDGIKGSIPYTGKKITQDFHLYDGEVLLEEKKDYTISYKNNLKAYEFPDQSGAVIVSEEGILNLGPTTDVAPGGLGEGYNPQKAPALVINMKGNYKGKHTVYFQIEKRSLGEADVDDITVTYTGKKINPKPIVTWNGKKLINNRDYEVKEVVKDKKVYLEPEKTHLTIIGKGNFKDARTINLTITANKQEVAINEVKVSNIKTLEWNKEKADSPTGIIQENVAVKYKGKLLTATTPDQPQQGDYIISYASDSNRKAGKATMILTGTGVDYNGDGFTHIGEKKLTFSIKGVPMNQVNVEGLSNGFIYTGQEILPLGKTENGVAFGNHTTSGNMAEAEEKVVAYAYNKLTSDRLMQGIHYRVAYAENINQGTATVTLTGIEEAGYTGSKSFRFKILPMSLEQNKDYFSVSVNDNRVTIDSEGRIILPYDKGGSRPEIEVFDAKGKTLKSGVDYIIQYKNNLKIASWDSTKAPVIIVKGKGNYKDTLEKNFSIVAKNLNDDINLQGMELYAKDKEFVDKKNGWKQSFQIYDYSGKKLTKADFDINSVVYKVIDVPSGNNYESLLNANLDNTIHGVPAGCTIQITVTMKSGGNYTGEISGTYRILEKGYDISKANIRLNPQVYTGNTIEIDDNGDLEKATIRQNGKTIELNLKDADTGLANLRVLEGSYVNNIKKGTARVTFEGIGQYGGRKTVTFKITQRSINMKNIWDGFFRLCQF